MIIQDEMIITSQKEIARNIFELKLEGKLVDEITSPGQFVHIRVGDSFDMLLRRPISIAEINRAEQEITIIYRAEGDGTRRLSEKKWAIKSMCLVHLEMVSQYRKQMKEK